MRCGGHGDSPTHANSGAVITCDLRLIHHACDEKEAAAAEGGRVWTSVRIERTGGEADAVVLYANAQPVVLEGDLDLDVIA